MNTFQVYFGKVKIFGAMVRLRKPAYSLYQIGDVIQLIIRWLAMSNIGVSPNCSNVAWLI
jgi:hypothetical protein